MPRGSYRPPAGFLTMEQARQLLGVSKATFQKIVRRRALVAHLDERDSRVRLIRTEDIDRLMRPVPVSSDPSAGPRP